MIDIFSDETISLQDTIAIEFFLEHLRIIFDPKNIENKEHMADNVILLAKSSYQIAQIFCETREQFKSPTNKEV